VTELHQRLERSLDAQRDERNRTGERGHARRGRALRIDP
jgi:hypothetical protein